MIKHRHLCFFRADQVFTFFYVNKSRVRPPRVSVLYRTRVFVLRTRDFDITIAVAGVRRVWGNLTVHAPSTTTFSRHRRGLAKCRLYQSVAVVVRPRCRGTKRSGASEPGRPGNLRAILKLYVGDRARGGRCRNNCTPFRRLLQEIKDQTENDRKRSKEYYYRRTRSTRPFKTDRSRKQGRFKVEFSSEA